MAGFGRGGAGASGPADPNNLGAYTDLATLNAAHPTPALGNYATIAGVRHDWNGGTPGAWVNSAANGILFVANDAARLALPDLPAGIFRMVHQDDTGDTWMGFRPTAASPISWTLLSLLETVAITDGGVAVTDATVTATYTS
jgi:hypothetical protein